MGSQLIRFPQDFHHPNSYGGLFAAARSITWPSRASTGAAVAPVGPSQEVIMPAPRTYAICEKFGMHARFLSSVGHYNTQHRFEGLVLPLRPEAGRQELNTVLRRDAKDTRGCHRRYASRKLRRVRPTEAESARAGGARAVIVIGLVAQVSNLQAETIPIMARGTSPRLIPALGGTAGPDAVDSESGWITRAVLRHR